jgi:hypothetical protein
MAQFNYTLPSGATFTMQAPAGTTQTQADIIFYKQVAAGALVGFSSGQSISGTTSALAKFDLSRLDRGTAGVDDAVILAIINGLPTTAAIPSLINTPLTNPITQANVVAIGGTGFTAPAIGPLTSSQTQAIMAQVVNIVDQSPVIATDDTGVGQYGFSCQQLEMAGYVKPSTWQQFLQNGASTLVAVLSAPGIWTGLNGINSLTEFLNNINAQNDAQARLMKNGYNSLQATGVIKTPAAQSISAVRGTIYTGTNQALTQATATVTNSVTSDVGALVANSSKYGTEVTAQWAATRPASNQSNSNTLNLIGAGIGLISQVSNLGALVSGITSKLPSLQTAMDALGKAAGFATGASSMLSGGLDKLSNITVDGLVSKLEGSATALVGDLKGQATALAGKLEGQAKALLTDAEAQAKALLANAEAQFNSLLTQADSLVTDVKKAAAFANTVDRATVDVATTKIFGSSKIPTPSFGADVPSSASIAAALDIDAAKSKLQELQGQGTALLGQAQGLANQAQGQATALTGQVRTAVSQIV